MDTTFIAGLAHQRPQLIEGPRTRVMHTPKRSRRGGIVTEHSARCDACGRASGPLPAAGMAHGWVGRHEGHDGDNRAELCPTLRPKAAA
jgi:hypothetical protein